MTPSLQPSSRKDPTVGTALILLLAIFLAVSFFLIPKSHLQNLQALLPKMSELLICIGAGFFYILATSSAWVRKNMLLKTPGQTLQVLKKTPEFNFPWRRILLLSLSSLLFSAFLTSLFSFQSKLLAFCLGWSGTQPWWPPAFALLVPFTWGCGDLCWAVLTRNRTSVAKLPALPPWPQEKGLLSITLGSRGEDTEPQWISLDEKELLKSMIITGGVGFGKTQLIFRCLDQLFAAPTPISFLILDPKGDMIPTIRILAAKNGREQDLVFLGTTHETRWNPLYFPQVQLAGRFRDVAERFKAAMINYQGGGSSDPFWIESGANLVGWLIWLSATAMGEVTFGHLYRLLLSCAAPAQEGDKLAIIFKQAEKKIEALTGSELAEQQVNLATCRLYLEEDFRKTPDKTRMNVVANLSSFLQLFLTAEAQRMFSPQTTEASFGNIRELLDAGKIILLDMTQNDRPGLCRAVGTFLKLSYQNAIMSRLADGQIPDRLACLVLDEYQNFATSSHGDTQFGDDRFFDQCRAAKGFGIIATQSYATLTMVCKKEAAAQELLGQIGHKITFATDEPSTCHYFRRLAGKKRVKRHSESISESGSDARKLFLQGDLTTERSSVGMSYSTSEVEVDAIQDEDIAKLEPFKAYAALKLNSGPITDFLFTRPLFDPKPEGPFKEMGKRLAVLAFCLVFSPKPSFAAPIPPNVCEAINTTAAPSCFDVRLGPCTCHTVLGIAYPCTRVSYWIPKAFVEVSPRISESYFSMIPTIQAQLKSGLAVWNWGINKIGAMGVGLTNVGVVDDNGASFYHVHTAPVFLSHEILAGLPCGSPGASLPCLSAMSEHHPLQWATGYFDLKQPQLYASGSMCAGPVETITSAVQSARRLFDGPISDALAAFGLQRFDTPRGEGCSLPLAPTLGAVNISTEPPCLGSLGAIFPRYGTVNGPTNISGALMAAYKFRSLAAEHFGTLPSSTEKWQLMRPKASSCFLPGENFLTLEGVSMMSLRDSFLFLIWEKRSCCKDAVQTGLGSLLMTGATAACKSVGRGW